MFITAHRHEQNTCQSATSKGRQVPQDPRVRRRSTCDVGVRRPSVSVDRRDSHHTLDCSV